MRISALRRPCFYVRPQYTRRETKSQARRHNPPRRRVCYTIAKLERREAGYESRSGTARACSWGSTLPPTTPRCGQRRLRSGAASPPCTRTLPVRLRSDQPGAVRAGARRCWPATRPSATCGAGLPPGADTAAAEAQKRPLHCAAVFFAERVFRRLLSSPGVKLLQRRLFPAGLPAPD